MAKMYIGSEKNPSGKLDREPTSTKVKRKYRILLAISIVSNVILTTLLVTKYIH